MDVVYDLRKDAENIKNMQRAMLSDGPMGLKNTHGLIGADEWWEQIADGSLPIYEETGVVSGFWPGQWATGPAEFELCDATGRKSHWLCEIEVGVARAAFRLNRPVWVRYVIQELKTAFEGRTQSKVTVSIALG